MLDLTPSLQYNVIAALSPHLHRQTYVEFDKLEAPFVASEHPAYRRFLAERAGMHDDFGSMARLAHMLVFTDDGRAAVAGPTARVERLPTPSTPHVWRRRGGHGLGRCAQ
eukprot:6937659-Prymnesium_polylepis.1